MPCAAAVAVAVSVVSVACLSPLSSPARPGIIGSAAGGATDWRGS